MSILLNQKTGDLLPNTSDILLINTIASQINNLKNWDENSLDIHLPESKFNKKDIDDISDQIKTFINKKSQDELNKLATDEFGNRKRLTEEQLEEISKSGKFKVKSEMFEGKDHVWQLTKFLQKGNDNINNNKNGKIINSLNNIYSSLNYLKGERKVTFMNGIKNVGYSLYQLMDKLIGMPKKVNQYSSRNILNILETERLLQLFDKLNITQDCKKRFLENEMITTTLLDGTIINLLLYNNNVSIKELEKNYIEFNDKWQKNRELRRDIYMKEITKGNSTIDYRKTMNLVIIKENEERENHLLNIINESLNESDKSTLLNYIKAKKTIRDHYANRETKYENDYRLFKMKLERENPILSKVEMWRNKKCEEFKKEWNKKYSIEKTNLEISSELNGQFKYLFDEYLNFYNSPETKNQIKFLNKKKKCAEEYTWTFEFKGKELKEIKTTTNYFGWRFANFALRASTWFFNGTGILINELLFGNFGLSSLFGNNKEYNSREIKTWFGRIYDLIQNIKESRASFLNKPDKGFLGKTVTNIGNIIWNYLFKGLIGIPFIFLAHPVITLLLSCLYGGLIGTSFIWAPLGSILYYLCNLMFFDTDSGSDDVYLLPLLNILVKEFSVKGIGQIVLSIFASLGKVTLGSSQYILAHINSVLNKLYDKLMFEIIIKNFSRVPSEDTFAAKRIEGVELSKDHYYEINYETALILLSIRLEELELESFSKYCESYVNHFLNEANTFYEQFNTIGLQLNTNSNPYTNIRETRDNLIQKIKKIFKKYKEDHQYLNINHIKNKKIKMTNDDLNKTLILGQKYAKDFIENKIFKYMNEDKRKQFWKNNSVFENDWAELTKKILATSINNDILVPIENVDNRGFKLKINEEKLSSIFKNLFENINDPLDSFEIIEPHNKITEFEKVNDTIDINNLKHYKYDAEKYIFIDYDILKKNN